VPRSDVVVVLPLSDPAANVHMLVKAAASAAPSTATTLAASALATRKSNHAIRGQLMVKRLLHSEDAIPVSPALPPTDAAPLAE
jgi:hypothetical protein